MMRTCKLLLFAAPALLLACSKEPAPAPAPSGDTAFAAPAPAATPSPPALAIDSEGLRLVDPQSGSARPLPFGTEWPDTLKALAFLGTPRTGHMDECGAGPLEYAKWENGFTLYSQQGAFMGWFADTQATGKLSTMSGIGPGSTRTELESAYTAEVFESTLGTEFMAGDMSGLLDGTGKQAKITALWAGLSCNFT